MKVTYPDRLAIERCLLAALILWPRRVELDTHHFVSSAHASLYAAIVDAGAELAIDDKTIPILRRFTGPNASLFRSVGGVENFVITELVPLEVHPDEVPALVESVRRCPRCGA